MIGNGQNELCGGNQAEIRVDSMQFILVFREIDYACFDSIVNV